MSIIELQKYYLHYKERIYKLRNNIENCILLLFWIFFLWQYGYAYTQLDRCYSYRILPPWAFPIMAILPFVVIYGYKTTRKVLFHFEKSRIWMIRLKCAIHKHANISKITDYTAWCSIILTIYLITLIVEDLKGNLKGNVETVLVMICLFCWFILSFASALPHILNYWFYRKRTIMFAIGILGALCIPSLVTVTGFYPTIRWGISPFNLCSSCLTLTLFVNLVTMIYHIFKKCK